jgi:hypothetical protein
VPRPAPRPWARSPAQPARCRPCRTDGGDRSDRSEQQRLAEGLLADAETSVVFGQAPGEAERAGELLGLARNEQALLCQLPRGVALWRAGQTSFLVEYELCPEELALADTDGAMR